jgi:hypothetical protein
MIRMAQVLHGITAQWGLKLGFGRFILKIQHKWKVLLPSMMIKVRVVTIKTKETDEISSGIFLQEKASSQILELLDAIKNADNSA